MSFMGLAGLKSRENMAESWRGEKHNKTAESDLNILI